MNRVDQLSAEPIEVLRASLARVDDMTQRARLALAAGDSKMLLAATLAANFAAADLRAAAKRLAK